MQCKNSTRQRLGWDSTFENLPLEVLATQLKRQVSRKTKAEHPTHLDIQILKRQNKTVAGALTATHKKKLLLGLLHYLSICVFCINYVIHYPVRSDWAMCAAEKCDLTGKPRKFTDLHWRTELLHTTSISSLISKQLQYPFILHLRILKSCKPNRSYTDPSPLKSKSSSCRGSGREPRVPGRTSEPQIFTTKCNIFSIPSYKNSDQNSKLLKYSK